MRDTRDMREETLRARLAMSMRVLQELDRQAPRLALIADVIVGAFRAGHKILLCGNGGSAADAEHLAAEFLGRFYLERRAMPAIALTSNVSALTAIGNDYGFDRIFARQVEALGEPGDVAVGLSTSGRSPNVIEAMREARLRGLHTVGLTGADGGELKHVVDHCIRVDSRDTPRIQEAHLIIGHLWCELVEEALHGQTVAMAAARGSG